MVALFYSSIKSADSGGRGQKTMEIGATTDVGLVRELNEDTILARTLPPGIGNPWHLTSVLMVADGLGGHRAGEVASQMAGETIQNMFIVGQANSWVPEAVTPTDVRQRITEAIQQVNNLVHEQSAEAGGTARPATTLTLCLTRDEEYHVGHVGDTRAYLIRDETITQLTEDDSWVGEAVRRGQMTQEEAQSSPFRNQLLKTVGTALTVEPTLYSGKLAANDVLLLCSDGMTEYVMPDEMLRQASVSPTLQAACDHLVMLARERGGHDNISVVMASPSDLPAKPRKPDTLPRATAATWPPVSRTGVSGDPNRHLRVILLMLVGSAALFVGLWVGHHFVRRAAPNSPAISAPAAASPEAPVSPASNKPEPDRLNRHTRRGQGRKHPKAGLTQPRLTQPGDAE